MNIFKKTLMSITNGNVIQDTFPNGHLVRGLTKNGDLIHFVVDGYIFSFPKDWWDAPYCGKGE